jgi:mannose-6-phosphate isomerase class I
MKYGININELEERVKASITKNQLPYDTNWIMGEVRKMSAEGNGDLLNHLHTIKLKDGNSFLIHAEKIHGELVFKSASFGNGISILKGIALSK